MSVTECVRVFAAWERPPLRMRSKKRDIRLTLSVTPGIPNKRLSEHMIPEMMGSSLQRWCDTGLAIHDIPHPSCASSSPRFQLFTHGGLSRRRAVLTYSWVGIVPSHATSSLPFLAPSPIPPRPARQLELQLVLRFPPRSSSDHRLPLDYHSSFRSSS